MIYCSINHSYYSNRTIKSISGIVTMIHCSINHSYDSNRTIKIVSGITTMIYCSINHSYDSNRTIKIISGIITMIQRSLHRRSLYAQHSLEEHDPLCSERSINIIQKNHSLFERSEPHSDQCIIHSKRL